MRDSEQKLAFGVERSDRRYRLRLARYVAMAERLAAIDAEAGRRLRLLDVGVGRGRTLSYLQHVSPEADLLAVGLDITDHWFRGLRRGPLGWQPVQADAAVGFPFSDARFDVVVCEQILEHMHEPMHVLEEIRRVITPEGWLIAGVPIFSASGAMIRRRLALSTDHVQTFTARRFRRLIAHAGFTVMDVRGFRVISGGVLRPLEDHAWWYRGQRALGRMIPGWCTEVQVVARRIN